MNTTTETRETYKVTLTYVHPNCTKERKYSCRVTIEEDAQFTDVYDMAAEKLTSGGLDVEILNDEIQAVG